MKAKKNKRERSAQIQQVSAGLRDVLGMTQWRKEQQISDVGRDRSGGRRTDEPAAGTGDPGRGADGRDRGPEAEAGGGTSAVCDLWEAVGGTRRADTLPADDGRGSGEADAHAWYLPPVWSRLFPPWMRS